LESRRAFDDGRKVRRRRDDPFIAPDLENVLLGWN
jgi:hypothetical protein